MDKVRFDPSTRQIQVFAAYCRAGSRKEAAHHLGVSETAVGAQLNKLYGRLGVTDAFSAARVLGWLVIPDLSAGQDVPMGSVGATTADPVR